MTRAWPLLLAVACSVDQGPRDGTFVGNPGKLGIAVVDADARLSLDAAEVNVVGVQIDRCDEVAELSAVEVTLDGLVGEAVIPLPGADLCRITLTLDAFAPVWVNGATDGGTTFTAILDPGSLVLEGVFRVDGDTLLVALSLADLDPDALEALGPDVAIGPGHPLADAAALTLAEGVALYEDVDADGAITAMDSLVYDPYAPDAAALSSSEAGCGCATGPTVGGGWLGGLLALVLRRRKAAATSATA